MTRYGRAFLCRAVFTGQPFWVGRFFCGVFVAISRRTMTNHDRQPRVEYGVFIGFGSSWFVSSEVRILSPRPVKTKNGYSNFCFVCVIPAKNPVDFSSQTR